ncbi:CD48 antigen-like isoform X1 [Pundamilia nyererei]|uniref:CD48 antigen-like isoform X1 n=1 Tax=Pundamilia nyererei TaxID=303518 RepID=A0A9Y3RB32_9CICH|nr:PREDICTED: CD48 antigen-like isoform X1 [Pundamilia nyererei]
MLRSVGLRILLLSVGLVLSDKDSFKKVGDKVVLSPGSVSDPITSITWKHGPDIAVEWYGSDIVPYRDFRGRCEVSTSTGTLTLSNVTVKDSGIYTAEINNRVMSPTKITVLSAVPKPTVSKSCNPEMTICTLTCEASITDDTKPVTYSWMTGDKQTAQPSSNQLTIAKNDTGSVEKSISCQLENPVSSERSDNIIISFASGDSLHWIIPVVIVLLVLIVAVIVFFLCKKYRKREIKTQDEANRPEEMVQLVGIQSNGADLSVQGTSSSSVVPALNSPNNVVTAPQIHNENELMSADDENEAEMSKTTSEVKDEPSQDQTPAASTDSSSKPGE